MPVMSIRAVALQALRIAEHRTNHPIIPSSSPSSSNRHPIRPSSHRALFALLVFLALDAERGLGPRLESLLADRLFANLADAERAVRDLLQREVELGQQTFLATAQPELERLEVLARRQVHLVRKVVGIERHVLHRQHLPRTVEDRLPLLFEEILKLLQLLLRELLGRRCGRGAHGSPPWPDAGRAEKRDRIVTSVGYDNPPGP